MAQVRDRMTSPADDQIEDHRARVEYEMKQRAEPIPQRPAVRDALFGGCASIAGEFYRGDHFQYCRNPDTCKAEDTIARQAAQNDREPDQRERGCPMK